MRSGVSVERRGLDLGKKGGEAAAKAKAEIKAKPIKDQPKDEGEQAKERVSKEIEGAGDVEQRRKLASDRVAEATREAAELKRQLAAERAERERLTREVREARQARPAATEEPEKAVQDDPDPEPQAEDFEEYSEYVKKLSRWEARQERAEWMREMGKRDLGELRHFLDKHVLKMPRTMLRYAIEKLEEEERLRYLRVRV